MGNQYEAEFEDVGRNTLYPFINSNDLPLNLILDITFTVPDGSRIIYLKSVNFREIDVRFVFADENETEIAYCLADYSAGLYAIKILFEDTETETVNGYLRVGDGVNTYSLGEVFDISLQEGIITVSNLFYSGSIQSLTPGPLTEGYNLDIQSEEFAVIPDSTVVRFVPNPGAGIGEYCGDELIPDAIYRINGVRPRRDGTMIWTRSGYMQLDFDSDNNRICFGLTIPEDRLQCVRTGFQGPQGFQGPPGTDGNNGEDAPPVDANFDPCADKFKDTFLPGQPVDLFDIQENN